MNIFRQTAQRNIKQTNLPKTLGLLKSKKPEDEILPFQYNIEFDVKISLPATLNKELKEESIEQFREEIEKSINKVVITELEKYKL